MQALSSAASTCAAVAIAKTSSQHLQLRPSVRRLAITILSFTMTLPDRLSHYTKYRLAHFVFYEHDPSCSLIYYPWSEARRFFLSFFLSLIISVDLLCVYGQTSFVQISGLFLLLFPTKRMLALDKIFITVSSTFVHTRHYNQHKMEFPCRGIK